MIISFGQTILSVQENDSSYRYRSLMQRSQLVLKFSLPRYVEIPVGATCVYMGQTFRLNQPQDIKKLGERNIEYTLNMVGDDDSLSLYKFRNSVDHRLKWSMCATPREFIAEIVANLNERQGADVWSVGTCITAAEKTIEFNHTSLDAALQSVAEAFETEWEIVGKTIHLRKVEYYKDTPVALSYGKGNGFIPGVGRTSLSDEQPIKRLYVQGGDRNIDRARYGSAELLLPISQRLTYEGHTYISSADGLYIERYDVASTAVKEDSLDCSDRYPSRIGTVSQWIETNPQSNFYDFIDDTIPSDLDYSQCLIAGETMTVIFQTGMLAGKEFEVRYHHAERRFEIVPQEIDGVVMPNSTFRPAAGENGDKYAVFGVMLPDSYICDDEYQEGASWDMFRDAARYLYEHEEQHFTFSGTLQGLWAKANWEGIKDKLVVGGYVNFTDPQFVPDGVLIRIVGIKDYLTSPYSPTIELSNSVSGQSFSSQMRKIQQQEVVIEDNRTEALQFTRRNFRDAQESIEALDEAQQSLIGQYSTGITPISVSTMAMLVGDEALQFRFVSSSTDPQPLTPNIIYTNGILSLPRGIIQHLTIGIDSVKPTHTADEYRYWNLSAASLTPADSGKKYFVYIEASVSGTSASYLLSETSKPLQQATSYYFLLGILNSVYQGTRSFATMYGFTEILPGRITTDKIVSTDGSTYFDLAAGEIGGVIKFLSGSDYITIIDGGYIRTDLIQAVSRVVAGVENGKRIEVDPDERAINVYDDSDNLVTTFEGNSYSGIDKLFGNAQGGSITPTTQSGSVLFPAGVHNLNGGQVISAAWQTTTPVSATIVGTITCTARSNGSISHTSAGRTNARIALYIDTFSDADCTTLIDSVTAKQCTVSASVSASATTDVNNTNSNANTVVRKLVAGYHRLRLEWQMTRDNIAIDTAEIGWSGFSSVQYVAQYYLSRFFANGFCIGSRTNNYVLAINDASDRLTFEAVSGGFGLRVTAQGIFINRNNGSGWVTL